MPAPLQILLEALPEAVNPLVGAAVVVLIFEQLIYVWHRAMHKNHVLWRAFHPSAR